MNYVYTYRVDGKVVYVGIGTEDGRFTRARDIGGHEHVKTKDYEKVEISIVARELKRKAARLLEAVLIRQHNETVLNKQTSANLPQLCDIQIERSGRVIDKKRRSEEAEFWKEYREFVEEKDWTHDSDETLRYLIDRHGFVPSKLKSYYDLDEVRAAQDAELKASRYETQNLHYEARLPADDPDLEPEQRIADYLNYYVYGEYDMQRIIQLAKKKSAADFCAYMWHYFVRMQLTSKRSRVDERLRGWFLGRRNKRPKIQRTGEVQMWRFERLYHFILISTEGFVSSKYR